MQKQNSMQQEDLCPYWLAGILNNPVRRLFHKPERILAGLVRPGQTVLDLGCGPGYFTLGMARMVGENGHVIAVDLQPEMLEMVRNRADREKLLARISLHPCTPDGIGLQQQVDFALAFWMLHEVPDQDAFLREVASLIKPGGYFLLAEPVIHVSAKSFQESVATASTVGLAPIKNWSVSISRGMLFERTVEG